MKAAIQFGKTTLLGGIVFLLPLVVGLILLREAVRHLAKLVRPLVKLMPAETIVGVAIADIIALAILILVAFTAGLFARTAAGRRMTDWIAPVALRKLPGFGFLGRIGKGEEMNAVLVDMGKSWQLGFVIERLPRGMLTLFMPSSPSVTSGSICFIRAECVKPLQASFNAAAKCIMQSGAGAGELLRNSEVWQTTGE